MTVGPDTILWLIGGLVTGLWGLLMWRLEAMERSRREARGILEAHVTEDRRHFDDVRETASTNHKEILEHLLDLKGGR